jgi:hypothetical protein
MLLAGVNRKSRVLRPTQDLGTQFPTLFSGPRQHHRQNCRQFPTLFSPCHFDAH